MKQVMFIKSVPIHTPTLAIQENGDIYPPFFYYIFGLFFENVVFCIFFSFFFLIILWCFIWKSCFDEYFPLFYIKIKKVSPFSCRIAFGVCMGTDFMNITCFIQKLSRFEVCMFLLSKMINRDRQMIDRKKLRIWTFI